MFNLLYNFLLFLTAKRRIRKKDVWIWYGDAFSIIHLFSRIFEWDSIHILERVRLVDVVIDVWPKALLSRIHPCAEFKEKLLHVYKSTCMNIRWWCWFAFRTSRLQTRFSSWSKAWSRQDITLQANVPNIFMTKQWIKLVQTQFPFVVSLESEGLSAKGRGDLEGEGRAGIKADIWSAFHPSEEVFSDRCRRSDQRTLDKRR